MRKYTLILSILLIGLFTSAADWDQPTSSTSTASIVSNLKDRDLSSAKMDYSSDSNVPTNVIRWNDSNDRPERWNGSSWITKLTDLDDHLIDVANPHAVTAAQVGNSTAQWNANKIQGTTVTIASVTDNEMLSYDSGSGIWTNQTAAELGLATTSSLSSHTSNTSNPHSVTASQAGALAAANNLSDLSSASSARSNLGLGTIATQSAASVTITGGTITGITPITTAAGGCGGTSASTCRSNISAAQSGANSDITSLTQVNSIGDPDNVVINCGSDGTGDCYLNVNGAAAWVLTGTYWRPTAPGAFSIGSASYYVNGVTLQRIDFRGTHGSSAKNPATASPDAWAEVQKAGTTYYLPLYLAGP